MKFYTQLRGWGVGFFILLGLSKAYAQYSVTSPDSGLKIKVDVSTSVQYSVEHNGTAIVSPSAISLSLSTGLVLGKNGTVASTSTRSVNQTITRLYGKSATLQDNFNELTINFTQNYSLIVRAYNEGVAYRFQTALGGTLNVVSEEANFNFAATTSIIFPEADQAMQSWERSYVNYASIASINAGTFSITPTMFTFASGTRAVVAESDLFDYPGMYLQPSGTTNGMQGKWAQYPKTVSNPTDIYSYHRVLTRENFLATTSGTRDYPWRVVIVSDDDKDLLANELIYKLAKPSVLTNTSYIKPGRSAWEWWHDAILDTNKIPSGLNHLGFDLYKYYIDFAAQYKIEYITMDAGWSDTYAAQVCQYAASKNVKVFAWDFINLPIENPNRLAQLKALGIAGVKVDLIERDDQVAINWFQQLAQACADQQMMIIFHGCGKPTGLERTYPNILNFEAVRGAENDKWDFSANPTYHLQFPFIRMLAGPLDYTPGSLRNVHRSQFNYTPTGVPMSMGTRTHELAMYVIFDQPLGYLCDSPTQYQSNPDMMNFLSVVPTTWDQTVPLDAKVEDYAVMAKQTGNDWFVGAMTSEDARDIEVDFSFLPSGIDKVAEIWRDNESTEANAKAYTREVITVNSASKLNFHLASEGGLVMHIQDAITGTIRDEGNSHISVYQSLDQTKVTVQAGEAIRSISIIDLSGKLCYQETVEGRQSLRNIDVASFPKGVYIVKVNTASHQYSSKIIR
ncbi:MAG TPA: glycoside hydrolase family 97 catalytic domain-containing protein [Ohtaekwangia sp.]|uniref:glycoside hydrolase family 97 catalytic domain-containing protein n=1 Tax=Ohtaekwangia sp. TaxID=2066019 RepID=UPI002F92734E